MPETPRGFYPTGVKRALDIVGSVVILILTAPVQVICAIAILLNDGRPVYFHQSRVGKDGQLFRLHKLRTMTVGTEQIAGAYPTAAMVTGVGGLLRRLSLDEIPQLMNILRGDMSFVGPRPTLLSQVERYTPEQRGRLAVRPGLTGLAQIRYRDDAPWSRRIITDLEYIRGISLRTDLRIVVLTIPAVLKAAGQILDDQDTAPDPDDLGPVPARTEDPHA
jgi:lipopolysaccharide/colanic/teichoic acid biosynthesis glycosyltransferase